MIDLSRLRTAARRSPFPALLVAVCVSLLYATLLFAPASSASAQPLGFRFADRPRVWSFPRDHGSHSGFATEWWYFTGSLQDEAGRAFGYELTFFRVGMRPDAVESTSPWRARDLILAHFAVTDIEAEEFHLAERLQRAAAGMAGADEAGLRVWVGDWEARQREDGRFVLKARHEGIAIDLELASRRPPVLHGQGGLAPKDESGEHASYYVSLPRMRTKGRLEIPGGEYRVEGTTWMDHEFFTGETPRDGLGWDWFSARFEDGRDLVLYRVRRPGSEPFYRGTLVSAEGSVRPVDTRDIKLSPQAWWKSPETGISYPVAWRIELPGEAARFTVRGLLDQQEVVARRTVGFAYWEGLSRYEGSWGGEPVAGEGYVELTGYGEE